MTPVFGGLQAMIWDQPVGPGVITWEMVEANPDRRPWVYADLMANPVTQGDGSNEPL
jgi:hypothetical protein